MQQLPSYYSGNGMGASSMEHGSQTQKWALAASLLCIIATVGIVSHNKQAEGSMLMVKPRPATTAAPTAGFLRKPASSAASVVPQPLTMNAQRADVPRPTAAPIEPEVIRRVDTQTSWEVLAMAKAVLALIPLAAMYYGASSMIKKKSDEAVPLWDGNIGTSVPSSSTALAAQGAQVHHLSNPHTRMALVHGGNQNHIHFAVFAMFERFTEKAVKVIMLAQEEARKSGHNHVGTEQLLLGMIGEGAGIASKMLKSHGMDLKTAREEVINIIGRGEGQVGVEIPFTPRAKKVLENSQDEARRLGHNYIGTEHLLLGLLKEKEGTANKVFEAMNVDREKVRYETIRTLADESKTSTLAGVGTGAPKSANEGRDPTLDEFTINLTEKAAEGLLDPVIGRRKEIERVTQILGRRTKNNPCLIGEPGVGKTAIAEGLAQLIVDGDVPETLADKTICQLDIALLVAGTKYRGEFEERLKKLLDEVKKSDDIILVIDEVHTLVGAGAAEGAIDAANIMKPGLARGELQVIGATTISEYRKHIEKDAALERRFQPVTVPEPSIEECIQILQGLKSKYEDHHKLKYSDEAIEASVKLAAQYISDRFLPDKAIDLLDEAGSRIRLQHGRKSVPEEARELVKELKALDKKKKEAIRNQDFENASLLRAQETDLEEKIKAIHDKFKAENAPEGEQGEEANPAAPLVTAENIASIVSGWTGIPVEKVTQQESDQLLNLEARLHEKVIGQNEAVSSISRAIRRARVGMKDPKRPIASMIFLGPTGVGKTELAKTLANLYFGSEDAMIRLDMSEFMERHTVSKLMGSPPGYVGYNEGGQLTEAVRKRPYSLLLFDEVEKAHPDVFNMMLQILEDGRLTDSQGRTVDFKNTLLIMTSNVGSDMVVKGGAKLGFQTNAKNENEQSYQQIKSQVQDAMKLTFKPEFLNRLDEIVVFRQLQKPEVKQVADIMLKEVFDRLAESGITLTVTDAFKDKLLEEGWNPTYGARPLRRAINTLLEDALAECILRGDAGPGSSISVDVRDGKIVVVGQDGAILGEKDSNVVPAGIA